MGTRTQRATRCTTEASKSVRCTHPWLRAAQGFHERTLRWPMSGQSWGLSVHVCEKWMWSQLLSSAERMNKVHPVAVDHTEMLTFTGYGHTGGDHLATASKHTSAQGRV